LDHTWEYGTDPESALLAGIRPPVSLERMLPVYFLQLWFNPSDPAVGEGLYASASMRTCAGIDQIWGRYAENR
jgi:hypothetical protein